MLFFFAYPLIFFSYVLCCFCKHWILCFTDFMSGPLNRPSSRVPSVWPSRFQAVDFDYWLDEISTSAANLPGFGAKFSRVAEVWGGIQIRWRKPYVFGILVCWQMWFATWNSSNLEDMLELKGVVATCKLFPTDKKTTKKIKTSNLTSESAHLSMA